ncbi:MAG TPA: diguanylate cyclase [Bacteroidota bacterium]|nr:diguanylate cyclase [Bacteroidota bacterium]
MDFSFREKVLDSLRGGGEAVFIILGVLSLVAGILVDLFVVRIVCLLVMAGSGLALFASMRARQLHIRPEPDHATTQFHSQSNRKRMKKMIFSDFESDGQDSFEGGAEGEGRKDSHGEQESQDGFLGTMPHPGRPAPMREIPPREYTISDFFDVGSDIYKGDSEPRSEFDFLLTKVLGVIKEVLFAHTVTFFWANREKQQMVLEARVTDSANFFSSRRFAMGHDLISSIAQTGKPEFLNEINPMSETEMFRYYVVPASIKSFVGVPVYFSRGTGEPDADSPVAVLAVDSKAPDDFGPETLALLGKFTKLISALIKSYNDKYDLLLDSELLNSIRRLKDRVRNDFALGTIVQALAEETSKLINWDFLTVVLYDETKHAWVNRKTVSRSPDGALPEGQVINFPDSIVGQAIRTNTHCLVNDLETVESIRYHVGEHTKHAGSLLSIPITSLNKCYGAITIESKEKFNFTRRDIEMLYRLAEHAASALEIYYMQEVIKEYVIIDDQTGTYSRKFFVQRVEEELQRADDAGSELSIIFVTVDKAHEITERFGNDGFERVMLALAKAIRSSVRSYDLVGRYDAHRFAALLIDTAANEAYIWAEKIRKNLAGLVINLDGKTFSITISVGVCGALEGTKKEELIGNAATVLAKASEAGGNVVRVF